MKRSSWFIAVFLIAQFLRAQPVINSFTPQSGPIGTSVTITGANFSPTPASNIVYFGAVKATVMIATTSSLTVKVPYGATWQPVQVITNGLTAYAAKPFIVTYTGGGNLVYNTFGNQMDLITDLHPNQLVITDLDGDGKPDIATANNYSTTGSPASVSILRNTSVAAVPSFAPKSDLITGVLTYAIAAGDLDGDGRPDLVSSSGADKTISIFRNTSSPGAVSFTSRTDFPTGDGPLGIGIGDLDGDGRPDIVVANWLSGTVSVFKNTSTAGNISFIKNADIPTTSTAENLALGDLDGDGKMDLIVVNDLSSSFSVFRNTGSPGTISFAPKVDVSTGTDNPFGVAIGDIDGDGRPDVVITNNNYTKVIPAAVSMSVFRNTGSPGTVSFAPKVNSTGTGNAGNPAITDLTGDGRPDIVVPNLSGSFAIYENGSLSGNIQFPVAMLLAGSSPNSVLAGDLDGDGLPDLAFTNFNSNKVSLFKNLTKTPHVYTFYPTSGLTGAQISITGDNFTGSTAVSFGGTPAASFTVINNTSISATVAGGSSGDISVTNQFGIGYQAGFEYLGPPTISSILPASADSGLTVTITGTNYTRVTGVDFGGTAAISFTVVSPSTIQAVVGTGTSGTVKVTGVFGAGTFPGYIVAPPSISSFSPASAGVKDTVTITGLNMSGVTAVDFGGAPSLDFVIASPTTIRAVVSGGASGDITVKTIRAVSIPGFNFVSSPPPVITSFSPSIGLIGSAVTISGTNFNPDPAKNKVWFGAVPATVVSATATSLSVTVPPGASYEPVSVLNGENGLIGVSKNSFVVTLPTPGAIDTNLFDQPIYILGSGTYTGFHLHGGLADLDGDGKTDLLGISEDLIDVGLPYGELHRYATVLRNTSTSGHISFQAPQRFPVNPGTDQGTNGLVVATADLDGDGKKDIIVLTPPHLLSIIRNSSTPGYLSFTPPVDYYDFSVDDIIIADMDGDGRLDIIGKGAVNGYNANIFRNTSTINHISLGPLQKFFIGGDLMGVEDMNGDGLPDMIVAIDFTLYFIQNTTSNGVMSFAAAVPIYSTVYDHFLTTLSIGDLDGDGRPDIHILNNSTAQGSFAVLRNTSVNNIISFVKTDYSVDGRPRGNLMADVNGDGKPDLVMGEEVGGRLSVYKNAATTDTILSGGRQNFLVNGYFYPEAMDFDGDGKMDLLVGAGPTFTILRNRMGESPSISIGGPVAFCTGGSVTLTSSAASANQWYKDSVAIAGASGQNLLVTTSGTYAVATLINGATSALAKGILVTVNPFPARPVVTRDASNELVSSNAVGNQWYTDTTAIIPGAVSQAYKPTVSGLYAVKTTQNGCSTAFSVVYNFILTAVQDLGSGHYIQVAPNPASNFLTITYNLPLVGDLSAEITDLNGKKVLTRSNVKNGDNIDIARFARGIYFLKLYSVKGKIDINTKVMKL